MNLRSPALAIGWEIWRRHRASLIATVALAALGAPVVAGLQGSARWNDLAGPVACALTAIALLLTLGSFHFTEGSKRGGFGRFPSRLFIFPIRTRTLVALPMIYGASAVVVVFLLCAALLLKPALPAVPLLWPCLYLVFALTQFQMILWSLAESRYLKLLGLGVAASIITFGWMFFVPTIVAGALSDWGYAGSPEGFMRRLLVGVALAGPGAYAVSLHRVQRQRHAKTPHFAGLAAAWERVLHRLRSRTAPFRSPEQAIFWLEWWRTGLVLPGVIVVITALTGLPTWLSGGMNGPGTAGVLTWLLISPFLFAAIIGRGFGKPDFWSASLRIPPFRAIQPVTAGQWVCVKLRVGLASAALTWAVTIGLAAIWTLYAGDFQAFEPVLRWLRFYYSREERWLLLLLIPPAAVIVTWRFLVISLASGMSGSKAWHYAGNLLLGVGLTAPLVLTIRSADRGDTPDRFHLLWPMVSALPAVLTVAVITKVSIAALAWSDVLQRGMISPRSAARYFAGWLCAVGILAALGFLLCRSTPWLRYLLVLGAMWFVPLARPALAIRTLTANRSAP